MLDARILLVLRLESKKATRKGLDTTLSLKEFSLCRTQGLYPVIVKKAESGHCYKRSVKERVCTFLASILLFRCSIALDMNSWGLTGHFPNWT